MSEIFLSLRVVLYATEQQILVLSTSCDAPFFPQTRLCKPSLAGVTTVHTVQEM